MVLCQGQIEGFDAYYRSDIPLRAAPSCDTRTSAVILFSDNVSSGAVVFIIPLGLVDGQNKSEVY